MKELDNGLVAVDKKELLAVIQERDEFKTDLKKVAGNLLSFIRKLGCLNEENKLQKPRLGKLEGEVTEAFSNPDSGLFKDLRDLEPEFDKYSKLVTEKS